MNEMQIFSNPAFGQVRTAGTPDNPLFCLADVCNAVELTNPSSVKGRLDQEDVQLVDLHALNCKMVGNSMATFINESGFYDVLLSKQYELFSMERQVAMLINDGFLHSYDQVIEYLRKKYSEKYLPSVLQTKR